MDERDTLIEALRLHRGFLLRTAEDLTEEQARTRSTVSELTIAGLLKHVADTEEMWQDFAAGGAAVGDARFALTAADTLERLRVRVAHVAAGTERLLATADLDEAYALPENAWLPPGTCWSVRRVTLHVLAETAQHAGHADIIREAIDGRKTMG